MLLVPVTCLVFLVTEKLWPARQFPTRRGWQWIGLGFLVLVMTIATVVPLWRGFHQMHHSPQRVDIAGSLVFHQTEIVVQTLLQLGITVIVLGLDPLAAALTGYFIAFNSFFQHWNVRTPQCIGYLIQRPEAHCVHHRRGFHYYNFADLTLWDMLFGTFRNPREFHGECGFDAGADREMGAMLAFADVNAPRYGPGNFGVKPSSP